MLVSREAKAIGRFCPSVRLFQLYLWNRLIFQLEFVCLWVMTIARLQD